MLHGETIHSPFLRTFRGGPPISRSSFGVLYLVLFVIGTGVGYVILRSIWDTCRGGCGCHGEEHRRKSLGLAFFGKSSIFPFLSSGRVFFVALLGEYFAKRG